VDFWNPTTIHDGGTKKEIKRSLERYPVFIRAGSIIPLAVNSDIAGHGGETSIGKTTLWIHPNGKTTRLIHLHENDGAKYSDISVSFDATSGDISLKGKKKRDFRFLIEMATKPKTVSGFDSWSYDSRKKRLTGDKTGDSFSIEIKK
jgi:alpha-glucosidase (family GH31 glycosyl hydrolase)